MKDQPLPLNSAVYLWPWVHFSLGFLTSFGRLSLSSLYEEKNRIPKNCLNQVKSVKKQHQDQTAHVWNKVSHFY